VIPANIAKGRRRRWGSANVTRRPRGRVIPLNMARSSRRRGISRNIGGRSRGRGIAHNVGGSSRRRRVAHNAAGRAQRRGPPPKIGTGSGARVVERVPRRLARSRCTVPQGLRCLFWLHAVLPGLRYLRCCVMRCLGVGLKWLSEGPRLLGGTPGTGRVAVGQWADRSGGWAEVVGQNLDEVGGKHAHSSPVAKQPAGPPRAIAGVEALDEVALNKTKIALGLRCGRCQCNAAAARRKQSERTSPPHEYTARTQHGKRVGSGGGARTIAVADFGFSCVLWCRWACRRRMTECRSDTGGL